MIIHICEEQSEYEDKRTRMPLSIEDVLVFAEKSVEEYEEFIKFNLMIKLFKLA